MEAPFKNVLMHTIVIREANINGTNILIRMLEDFCTVLAVSL